MPFQRHKRQSPPLIKRAARAIVKPETIQLRSNDTSPGAQVFQIARRGAEIDQFAARLGVKIVEGCADSHS